MFAECPIHLQLHEAITKRKFLSTLFASFQSRSELEHSSSRYVSDSSLPLRLQAVHESSEIQAGFPISSPYDTKHITHKSLSHLGYQCFLWRQRSYDITTRVCSRKVFTYSPKLRVYFTSSSLVVATTLHNFIPLLSKTSSLWFWVSDFLGLHLTTSSLASYYQQGQLITTELELKAGSRQHKAPVAASHTSIKTSHKHPKNWQ